MYYDEERTTKKTKPVWLYVLVILLYFTLIGIVIAILLLAPKYPSFTSEASLHEEPPPIHIVPDEENPVIVVEDISQQALPPYLKKKHFRPSPVDPLYPGIDPRRYLDNTTSNETVEVEIQ